MLVFFVSRTELLDADFSSSTLQHEISLAEICLNSVTFHPADLPFTDFSSASVDRTNISNAHFIDFTFPIAHCHHVDLSKLRIAGGNVTDVELDHCHIHRRRFHPGQFHRSELANSNCSHTSIRRSNSTISEFNPGTLSQALLNHVRCRDGDLIVNSTFSEHRVEYVPQQCER